MESDCLDGDFEAATSTVAELVASGSKLLTKDDLLQFYSFYKQATAGPCTTKQPAMWDFGGRAKWAAWKGLADMGGAAAKAQYVSLLDEKLGTSWREVAEAAELAEAAGVSGEVSAGGRVGAVSGPVVSTLAGATGERDGQGKEGVEAPETLHHWAGQGNHVRVKEMLDIGAWVDEHDEDGCTPLHWAADRGAVEVCRVLLAAGASANAQDNDGQSPLHYAAMCEQLGCCEVLLAAGCDPGLQDASGTTAATLGPASWTIWPSARA